MSSPPGNVPTFLVKNWRWSSQHHIYRNTHKMRHQTYIREAAFVSLSPVTQTDASPQKASIILFWTTPTQPSPSPFIITFHERSFNESPQHRAAEYCFALFVLSAPLMHLLIIYVSLFPFQNLLFSTHHTDPSCFLHFYPLRIPLSWDS